MIEAIECVCLENELSFTTHRMCAHDNSRLFASQLFFCGCCYPVLAQLANRCCIFGVDSHSVIIYLNKKPTEGSSKGSSLRKNFNYIVMTICSLYLNCVNKFNAAAYTFDE